MRVIADLHIHSSYSRACSKDLTLENLEKYARIKGIGLLGTGDFTHPKWIQEIKSKLREDENGILHSSSGFPFTWQTELSLAYTQNGKGRRIHYIILAPSGEVVGQITEFLLKKGRVDYDGRPIFGMSSVELLDELMKISSEIELIPAHLWTSWFGCFGSESGFDSLKECFGEKTKHIHAIETGMSSDPAMNWRIKELDEITLMSNSDCHSYWPWRMGREANVFEFKELTYKNVLAAIRERKGFIETIETPPSYGKYHFDGHRMCNVVMSPAESAQHKNICPKCGSKMTIGVLNRVEQLAAADRPEGFVKKDAIPFKSLIPLSEIIAELNGVPVASRKTWQIYNSLIERFGNEFNVLLDAAEEELKKVVDEKLAAAIMKNREGRIKVEPGYDGVYGKPILNGGSGNKGTREARALINPDLQRRQKGLNEYF
ncbi:DNA helicase UvrD [Candidatus Woesearchaeota archaeon]|nr:DNA helicase UvrD [Candidatus Woesearchaeota archaeon]